jgi:hypothetical protein
MRAGKRTPQPGAAQVVGLFIVKQLHAAFTHQLQTIIAVKVLINACHATREVAGVQKNEVVQHALNSLSRFYKSVIPSSMENAGALR